MIKYSSNEVNDDYIMINIRFGLAQALFNDDVSDSIKGEISDFYSDFIDYERIENDKGEEKLLEFKWVTAEELKNTDLRPINIRDMLINEALEDNVFTVHCLDKDLANGIETCAFVTILKRLEEE